MAKLAVDLVRELANRLGELVVFTSTAAGTTTSVVSSNLVTYLPSDVSQLNAWVYCSGGTAANVGKETRAKSWTVSTSTLSLYSSGFPQATASNDTFELHLRTSRTRKLAAINSGIAKLGLLWYREVIDESLTTAQNQWQYTLPSSVKWSRVSRIEIQVSTDPSLNGYPYASADAWDWEVRRSVSSTGSEVFTLQFGKLPPPGRKIRIFGEAWFSELSSDTDTLPLAGRWEAPALEWLYDWAEYRIMCEQSNILPTSSSQRYDEKARRRLERQLQELMMTQPPHPGRIVVPGRGRGQLPYQSDPRYLGAFRSEAMS